MNISAYIGNTGNPNTPVNGSTYAGSAETQTLSNVSIPISGWSNSSSIIGSFAGVPAVPGYEGKVDTFSVSYGTTNATTVCSASPCSYLDQIGTAVTSVTRSSAGSYSLNTVKTYVKLKCTASVHQNGTSYASMVGGSCSNCSAIAISTGTGTSSVDTTGTVSCQGTY